MSIEVSKSDIEILLSYVNKEITSCLNYSTNKMPIERLTDLYELMVKLENGR